MALAFFFSFSDYCLALASAGSDSHDMLCRSWLQCAASKAKCASSLAPFLARLGGKRTCSTQKSWYRAAPTRCCANMSQLLGLLLYLGALTGSFVKHSCTVTTRALSSESITTSYLCGIFNSGIFNSGIATSNVTVTLHCHRCCCYYACCCCSCS